MKVDRELEELREALRDLAYELCKTFGIIRLVKRFGLTPKPWVREREIRELHSPEGHVTRLRELVERLYEFPTCAVGGPLHIVTDDGNVEDAHLDFCERELADHWSIETATPTDAKEIVAVSAAIIAALRKLSVDDRKSALRC